jgi:hypothetical protein
LYIAVQEDIAKDVETKVMNYVTELEEKLKEKEELINRAFEEWSDNDTKIEKMLEPILGKEFIEGNSYCVPGTVWCVEELVKKYNEAAKKIKGLIDIQKQNGNYNCNEFMYGMLIGLECAYYTLLGEHLYKHTERPEKWLDDNIPKDFVPTVAEDFLD